MNAAMLDCGHVESPHADFTRGYGVDNEGRKHCYDCCVARDKVAMARDGRIGAYLSGDGKHVTTWTGHALMTVTREWERNVKSFGSTTTATFVNATDDTGAKWYGRGTGRGMFLTMRRMK